MSFGQLERDGFDAASATPMSDINVTPLVDVMLVLLVIFMITAPLLVGTVKLELPQAESVEQVDAAQALSLVMAPDASLQLDNRPIGLTALKARLSEVARAAPDTEVLLRADTTVPYGRVVEVIGLVQAAGLSRIGFVADPPGPASPHQVPRQVTR